MFKKGDLVECVDNNNCRGITIGRLYKVLYIDEYNDPVIRDNEFRDSGYLKHRFKLCKFQEGMRAFSIQGGWGTISYNRDIFYPITLTPDNNTPQQLYTCDGRYNMYDVLPSLFLNEVKLEDWPNPDPVLDPATLVEDQEIEIQLSENEGWSLRKFAMLKNGSVWVYAKDRDSKTCKTMYKVCNFRLPKPNSGV